MTTVETLLDELKSLNALLSKADGLLTLEISVEQTKDGYGVLINGFGILNELVSEEDKKFLALLRQMVTDIERLTKQLPNIVIQVLEPPNDYGKGFAVCFQEVLPDPRRPK